MPRLQPSAFVVFWLLALTTHLSWAEVGVLPSSVAALAVSESMPTAFPPAQWSVSDFEVMWRGGSPAQESLGVSAELVPGSLEWVRVAELLVVPRARLRVRVSPQQGGVVEYAGATYPISGGTAEISVALIESEENEFRVRFGGPRERGSGPLIGGVKYRAAGHGPKSRSQVLIDPSCSRYSLTTMESALSETEWAYFGCRLIYDRSSEAMSSILEVRVLWSGTQRLAMNGVELTGAGSSVWTLRLRSQPGRVELRSDSGKADLSYRVADRARLGFVGLGLGPYLYAVDTPGLVVDTVAPVLTLYGSYLLNETTRVVVFDAISIHRHFFTDFGLYLNYESARLFDRRLSLNFLLGGHALIFRAPGGTYTRLGLPQGVELIYRDAFRRSHNLGLGAFVFPEIAGKAYYNTWIRWGSPALFGEFNYIAWREELGSDRIFSRSVGLTLGFPLTLF